MNEFVARYRNELEGFHKRVEGELTILLYHGVSNTRSKGIENYCKKHILQEEFASQMDFIRKNCNAISVDEFLFARENDEPLPSKSVIISFDDGFRNNYTVAAPILAEKNIPAVFYITSGIVNTDIMFWVDVLEDCINLSDKGSISIQLEQKTDFPITSGKEKIIALERIKSYCKVADVLEKDRIIAEVQETTGITASVKHTPNYEKISWNELRQMHANNLFTIGGHSLYHNILSFLDDTALEKELRASLDLLEINLKSPITHYSYPEGLRHHYNERTIELLKGYGIICSPSAIPGLNAPDADLFQLRRIMVGFCGIPFPFWDKTI